MGKYSMKTIKKNIKQRMEIHAEEDANKTRMRYYDRWAKISGVEPDENGNYDWSKIDYDNEFVALENYLCDGTILMKIGDPKYYAEGLKLIPEHLHETL